MEKCVVIAPFWHQKNNVGQLRIQSFVKWLQEAQYHVVVVAAGANDHTREEKQLTLVTVRDPLGICRDDVSASGFNEVSLKKRKPNRLRRMLANVLFCPDPMILWVKNVLKRKNEIVQCVVGAKIIISSSPTESSHILGYKLSKTTAIPLVLDYRDGWLDDPLKPLVRNSRIRRWYEGRIEKKIVKHASHIFTVTEVLTHLLTERLTFAKDKATTLTNSYFEQLVINNPHEHRKTSETLTLYYIGSFSCSDHKRTPDLLFTPILSALKSNQLPPNVKIMVIGNLNQEDRKIIQRFAEQFKLYQWVIEVKEVVPRDQVLQYLRQADGLLILSVPITALTRKLFEYICSGRPFLAVTPQNSALWNVCEKLPQAFLLPLSDSGGSLGLNNLQRFIRAADHNEFEVIIPNEFSEKTVKTIFLRVIMLLSSQG